jgi:hypothetical protein
VLGQQRAEAVALLVEHDQSASLVEVVVEPRRQARDGLLDLAGEQRVGRED